MERPGRFARWYPWLAGAALAVVMTGLLPPVQARGKALAVLVEAVGGSFPRPFAAEVSASEAVLDGVAGDLYAPPTPSPSVLLLPGAAPLGRRDPRVVRLARALARAGRRVFVPELDLYDREFTEADLDRIVRASVALGAEPSVGEPVTILGISYGGSLALVAAADPRLEGRLGQVAVFGAFFDLVGVIQAVTTGVSVVGSRRIPWDRSPVAKRILEHQAARLLAPEGTRDELRAALDGELAPSRLPDGARPVYDLVQNQDPGRTVALASALPDEARAFLARYSPATVADRLEVPVIAMHSTDDPAVPYAEAGRLLRALPGTRLVIVGSFRHVDLKPGSWGRTASDFLGAWRFATWLLAAQE